MPRQSWATFSTFSALLFFCSFIHSFSQRRSKASVSSTAFWAVHWTSGGFGWCGAASASVRVGLSPIYLACKFNFCLFFFTLTRIQFNIWKKKKRPCNAPCLAQSPTAAYLGRPDWYHAVSNLSIRAPETRTAWLSHCSASQSVISWILSHHYWL